jgi:hypothetical protein
VPPRKPPRPPASPPLATLINLESLSIYDGLATDESAAFISNLPNLTTLEMSLVAGTFSSPA